MIQSNIQGIEIAIAIGSCSGGMILFFDSDFDSDPDFEFTTLMKSKS